MSTLNDAFPEKPTPDVPLESSDEPGIEVELFSPEECGWVRVSDQFHKIVYEKPDGSLHIFSTHGGSPAILRLKSGWPPKWYGTSGQ